MCGAVCFEASERLEQRVEVMTTPLRKLAAIARSSSTGVYQARARAPRSSRANPRLPRGDPDAIGRHSTRTM
ncbi:hypothetical protein BE15_45550 [Sorangium cellulosum]|uniref:Uncharacterized protein n=1 Tax=Sorangium cellulosum TaxID=56 RepID=A0A150QW21_SORCE|nr:hypothetical protein BE15_45550 [Sorangium cellulosum]